jgi:predicted amidohydrolase
MDLQPWKINHELKGIMAKNGIRNTLNNAPDKVDPYRESKRFPIVKLINKLGLKKYNLPAPLTEVKVDFPSVTIPLGQHIGAPAVPCVNVGDSVQKGDVIAKPAEGKLGACIHASISGVVQEIANNNVTIGKDGVTR